MDGCYELPEQVLFGILSWLPVMSLLRFKAVCKSWFSLIESPFFVSEHLNHSRDSKEDNLIILGYAGALGKCRTRKFALLSGSEYEECVYNIDVGQFWHPSNEVYLTGYCDGIVCLGHFGDGKTTLWNPALKQVITLPSPLFANRSELGRIWYYTRTSFGFDAKRKDYKVIKMLYSGKTCKNQVEVYSLGGDDSWRIIHKNDVLPFFHIHTSSIAVSSGKSGKCYWIASRKSSNDEALILLSFDFSNDAFATMLLPTNGMRIKSSLDLLDDKVTFITKRDSVDGYTSMGIWVLHEFGVEMSWNLIHTFKFKYMCGLICPQLISKSGEYLVCGKLNGTVLLSNCGEYFVCGTSNETVQGEGGDRNINGSILYLCNLRSKHWKSHQKCNIEPSTGRIIHYNASLISLKTAKNARLTK